jgi:hypothetical protein
MNEYRTPSGRVLTDADIQALADEAEQGYDVEHLKREKKLRDEAEFFEQLSKVEGADEMDFVLTAQDDDPELTFSVDGLEAIEQRMRAFIAARIHAEWERSCKAPKKMRLRLGVNFTDDSPKWNPWYELPDTIDGGTRIEALRDVATEDGK